MTNFEIREKARQDLGGRIFGERWMTALAAALIYSLIIGACSAVPYVGQVATLLLSGPLLFGLVGYFIKLIRNIEKPTIDGLFDGFSDFSGNFLLYFMTQLFTFLWALLFIIPGIVKSYAYSMAFYIKRDNPSYSWRECLDESQRMMQGKKWQLFCLDFSFLGWIILGMLCLGIGTLWVTPYMQASHANFYESLVSTLVAEEPTHQENEEDVQSTNTFETL